MYVADFLPFLSRIDRLAVELLRSPPLRGSMPNFVPAAGQPCPVIHRVALALCSREAGVVQQYVMRRWQEFADERTASESSESTPFL